VEETQWHLKTNAMHKVHALFGLVGNAQSGQSTDFYLLPSNLGSSQFPVYEPGKPPKGKWKKVSVPQLSLEEDWLKCVGDKRCDLLKVDIEGSEGELLKNETKFLERVDSIILEWHKWIVTENEIQSLLDLQGFERVELLEELEGTGIAWYRRSK